MAQHTADDPAKGASKGTSKETAEKVPQSTPNNERFEWMVIFACLFVLAWFVLTLISLGIQTSTKREIELAIRRLEYTR